MKEKGKKEKNGGGGNFSSGKKNSGKEVVAKGRGGDIYFSRINGLSDELIHIFFSENTQSKIIYKLTY